MGEQGFTCFWSDVNKKNDWIKMKEHLFDKEKNRFLFACKKKKKNTNKAYK